MERQVPIFTDTNMGTHLVFPVSPDITTLHFKRELEGAHIECFPELGKVTCLSVMVKQKSNFYHMPDSLPLKHGLNCEEVWFVHVDVSPLDKLEICSAQGNEDPVRKASCLHVNDHMTLKKNDAKIKYKKARIGGLQFVRAVMHGFMSANYWMRNKRRRKRRNMCQRADKGDNMGVEAEYVHVVAHRHVPDSSLKKKYRKKKSEFKKNYEVSDSEENVVTTSNNSARDLSRCLITESDEDYVPISSLRGTSKNKHEDLKRKMHHVSDCNDDENQSKVENKKKKRKEDCTAGEARSNVDLDKDGTKSPREHRKPMLENDIKTDSDGLLVEDIITGKQDGKVASVGKKVTIHYTAKLKTSGQVFDSSFGKKPLKFCLGEDIVLDGMDCGIVGMRVGGKRRLVIPPLLGYGSDGTDRVPPDSWLIIEIELLQVHE